MGDSENKNSKQYEVGLNNMKKRNIEKYGNADNKDNIPHDVMIDVDSNDWKKKLEELNKLVEEKNVIKGKNKEEGVSSLKSIVIKGKCGDSEEFLNLCFTYDR